MSNENVKYLSNNNFDEVVGKSDSVVFVDFWAPWCGPCQMIGPIIEELANDYSGKAVVAKVNVDDESDISQKYKIRSIPTIMIFKNGEAVDRVTGSRNKKEFAELIDKHL